MENEKLDIADVFSGDRLRVRLAQAAYCLAEDKEQVEKSISVSSDLFEKCMVGMPEHHKNFNRKRAFIRTYHEAFWTENKEGMGRTYHHGVVHIINKDSEVNSTYEIDDYSDNNFNQTLQDAIKIKGHRLIDIYASCHGVVVAKLSRQRWNLDND